MARTKLGRSQEGLWTVDSAAGTWSASIDLANILSVNGKEIAELDPSYRKLVGWIVRRTASEQPTDIDTSQRGHIVSRYETRATNFCRSAGNNRGQRSGFVVTATAASSGLRYLSQLKAREITIEAEPSITPGVLGEVAVDITVPKKTVSKEVLHSLTAPTSEPSDTQVAIDPDTVYEDLIDPYSRLASHPREEAAKIAARGGMPAAVATTLLSYAGVKPLTLAEMSMLHPEMTTTQISSILETSPLSRPHLRGHVWRTEDY